MMVKLIIKRVLKIFILIFEIFLLPCFVVVAILSRIMKKTKIGLGPYPLINNLYHKKALRQFGYNAETFVDSVFFITDEFDFRFDRFIIRSLLPYIIFLFAIFRYKGLYFYFNGGPLYKSIFLWRVEGILYKLANLKTVLMPYGSDVQDMNKSGNLLFKEAVSKDYPLSKKNGPRISKRVNMWVRYADHIIGGCDWVDYLPGWDTLMLAHFSIDTEKWKEPTDFQLWQGTNKRPLRIFHAPNHRNIKGTEHFLKAIEDLNKEGLNIELILAEKVPNNKIHEILRSVDIIADQLIVGWYAMFALEGMSMGKIVLCYLDKRYINLYQAAGIIKNDTIPIVNCSPFNVKDAIRDIYNEPERIEILSKKGREFVKEYHSTEAVGKVFHKINSTLGIPQSLNTL